METISLLEIASKLSLKQKHSHFLKKLGLNSAVGREVVIFFSRIFSDFLYFDEFFWVCMTTNNNLIVKNFSLKEQHFMGSHHVQGTGSLWQKEVDSNELKCFNLFLLELFNKILLTGCLILLKEVFVHWVVYFFQVFLCL